MASAFDEKRSAIFSNTVVYVLAYVLFMIPTYILPYLGSNSFALNSIGTASGAGLNPAFWPHLVSLVVLVGIADSRGIAIQKKWLDVFPFLALIFDLVPFLNWVPLVPTVMHLCAIIIGAKGSEVSSSQVTE